MIPIGNCPYCRGPAISLRATTANRQEQHWVECYASRECGARGPHAASRDLAIAAWNKIAGPDVVVVVLAAEVRALRLALQTIVDAHDACSELFTNHEDCAANLADRARKALGESHGR